MLSRVEAIKCCHAQFYWTRHDTGAILDFSYIRFSLYRNILPSSYIVYCEGRTRWTFSNIWIAKLVVERGISIEKNAFQSVADGDFTGDKALNMVNMLVNNNWMILTKGGIIIRRNRSFVIACCCLVYIWIKDRLKKELAQTKWSSSLDAREFCQGLLDH